MKELKRYKIKLRIKSYFELDEHTEAIPELENGTVISLLDYPEFEDNIILIIWLNGG